MTAFVWSCENAHVTRHGEAVQLLDILRRVNSYVRDKSHVDTRCLAAIDGVRLSKNSVRAHFRDCTHSGQFAWFSMVPRCHWYIRHVFYASSTRHVGFLSRNISRDAGCHAFRRCAIHKLEYVVRIVAAHVGFSIFLYVSGFFTAASWASSKGTEITSGIAAPPPQDSPSQSVAKQKLGKLVWRRW